MNYQNVLLCAQSKFLPNWGHSRDYHWFYAKSFGMSWFREEWWEGMIFDWELYWREISKADNIIFFRYEREHLSLFHLNANVPSQETLESHDAAKTLYSLGMDFNYKCYNVKRVKLRRINTLRLFHEKTLTYSMT